MTRPTTRNPASVLTIILIVSVVLRVAAALYLGNQVEDLPGTSDQISYHALALRLIEGHGFTFGKPWWPATAANAPTAHWSYLYTVYLAAVYALFGVKPLAARLIQAVLVGIIQPYLVYLIGKRVFGKPAGLAAAGFTAIYTYFIYYSATLMTEPFYMTAILASLHFALVLVARPAEPEEAAKQRTVQKQAIALGLALSAAVLLRQLFLLFIPFLFLWIWWAGGRRRYSPLLIASLILVGCLLPITLFNYARFNRFVLLNTNAGYAFFWANHPIYGTRFVPILTPDMGSYQDLIPPELRGLDEASLDQALLQRGIGFILDDPVRYALLTFSRIPVYFMFWPSPGSGALSNLSRLTSFGLLWPFMLFGLVRASTKRSNFVILLYLFTGIYTAIHLLSWALIRYRLPVDAVLVIFAGQAAVGLTERVPALRQLNRIFATDLSDKRDDYQNTNILT